MKTLDYERCRSCFSEKNNLIDMKTKIQIDCNEVILVDCFNMITGLNLNTIEENTKICTLCEQELISAYKFRQKALNAHQKWTDDRYFIHITSNFKQEDNCLNSSDPIIKAENLNDEDFPSEKVHPSKRNVSRRKRQFSESEEQIECAHCPKKFNTKRYLTNHLLRKHFNNMKSHLCDNCGQLFLGTSELRNHIRTTHTNELPYTCHLCPRSYKTLQSLKVHLTSHSDLRPFICEKCPNTSFKTRGALFNHRRLHQIHDDPFECKMCHSKFSTKLYYEKHLRSHSIQETVRCPECNKCYKNQAIFKLHERTHTGQMFKCNLCPKQYNTKEKLSKHFLCSHSTEEKQFKCNLCSSAFFVNHKLNRHLKNIHKIAITVDKRKLKRF